MVENCRPNQLTSGRGGCWERVSRLIDGIDLNHECGTNLDDGTHLMMDTTIGFHILFPWVLFYFLKVFLVDVRSSLDYAAHCRLSNIRHNDT